MDEQVEAVFFDASQWVFANELALKRKVKEK